MGRVVVMDNLVYLDLKDLQDYLDQPVNKDNVDKEYVYIIYY